MMFISHYNKSNITCTNDQFDELLYDTQMLFKVYGKDIFMHHILDALFENDDIYYSAKYLFKSKKSIEELYPRYCNLAKLIFIYFTDKVYGIELDSVVHSLSIKRILLEDIQEINK